MEYKDSIGYDTVMITVNKSIDDEFLCTACSTLTRTPISILNPIFIVDLSELGARSPFLGPFQPVLALEGHYELESVNAESEKRHQQ